MFNCINISMMKGKTSEEMRNDDSMRYRVNCYPSKRTYKKDNLMEAIDRVQDERAAAVHIPESSQRNHKFDETDYKIARNLLLKKGTSKEVLDKIDRPTE